MADDIPKELFCAVKNDSRGCKGPISRTLPEYQEKNNELMYNLAEHKAINNNTPFTNADWLNHEWYRKFVPWSNRWPGGK